MQRADLKYSSDLLPALMQRASFVENIKDVGQITVNVAEILQKLGFKNAKSG